MSFLSKKPKKNKLYPLKKAMKIVSENEGFSVVAENGGYRIISDKTAREGIDRYKKQIRQREAFTNSLQTGYTSNSMGYNQDSIQRYSYYEKER